MKFDFLRPQKTLENPRCGVFGALRSSAGDTVRLIRELAESQPKPSIVCQLAQIRPLPPVPPPAQSTDLAVTLDASGGNLILRWKAANPSGTSNILGRRLPGESECLFIGMSGKKEFIVDTLIAGADSMQKRNASRIDQHRPETRPPHGILPRRRTRVAGLRLRPRPRRRIARRHERIRPAALVQRA